MGCPTRHQNGLSPLLAMQLPLYLDHAATTPTDPAVVEAMLPYFTEQYGNPAALYSLGMAAHEAVETARETVADLLHASPEEIIFTSGGTESNNMALWGAAYAAQARGRHLLTTPIEHHAILEPMQMLTEEGFEVEYLPVDGEGQVDPEDVAQRIRPDTTLVSVMHANNEVGTVLPIGAIGAICRERGVIFHTDAVQTLGKLPLDVRVQKIDMLSGSAHKCYGPKGVGVLYVRRGISLKRFQAGGEQEKGRRAGTLNTPGIVGIGKAIELRLAQMQEEAISLAALRERFLTRLTTELPGIRVMGSRTERLPNNIHCCVEGVEGETLLLALDAAGICASAGSACTAGSNEPSHVLLAMGVAREVARGALRLTLGKTTTTEALDYTYETLHKAICGLRGLKTA